jgi:hypothetical protein
MQFFAPRATLKSYSSLKARNKKQKLLRTGASVPTLCKKEQKRLEK